MIKTVTVHVIYTKGPNDKIRSTSLRREKLLGQLDYSNANALYPWWSIISYMLFHWAYRINRIYCSNVLHGCLFINDEARQKNKRKDWRLLAHSNISPGTQSGCTCLIWNSLAFIQGLAMQVTLDQITITPSQTHLGSGQSEKCM